MNKTTFNKLNICMQVQHFNTQLNKGENITQVCQSLEISYSTIRDRFKRNDYMYNKISNKYENLNILMPLEVISEDLVDKIVNTIHFKYTELNCDKRESPLKSRSFRIHSCVLDEFISFCNESNFNQQDILSQFISEGLIKYKK